MSCGTTIYFQRWIRKILVIKAHLVVQAQALGVEGAHHLIGVNHLKRMQSPLLIWLDPLGPKDHAHHHLIVDPYLHIMEHDQNLLIT